MVNKPLIRPYFWGGTLGGGRLTSHDYRVFVTYGSVYRRGPLHFNFHLHLRGLWKEYSGLTDSSWRIGNWNHLKIENFLGS